jgi:hypothetical protein
MHFGPASDRRLLELLQDAEQALRRVVLHPEAARKAAVARELKDLRQEQAHARFHRRLAGVMRRLSKRLRVPGAAARDR